MRRTFLGLLAAACLIAAPLRTSAQELSEQDERARTHFDAGRLHYEEGAYDRALAEFTRAWELSHRPVLLVNLATVKERLGMYQEAADHLREYLRLTPEEPERARLERRIANLERLARERASSATPAAEASSTTPSSTSPGPDGGLLGGAIAGFGVAVVGGVLMGVFGGLALDEDAQLAAGCGASGSCTDAEVADANTFALVSDVGLGVLVAGAAAGTVLLVLALTASGGGTESALVVPWLAPDAAGVATEVRF